MSELPPGFVLDNQQDELPPGFVIDGEKPKVGRGEDFAKSVGSGLANYTASTLGGLGSAREMAAKGVDYAVEKAGGSPETAQMIKSGASKVAGLTPVGALANYAPSRQDIVNSAPDPIVSPDYAPQYETGQVGKLTAELAGGALLGGGSVAGGLIRNALIPAVATRTAENALPESSYKPWLVAGAGLGSSMINPAKAITPLETSAARAAAVQTLENEGVNSLTAGQRTGNARLQYLESAASHQPFAGGGAEHIQHEGGQQFTEAATRKAGPISNAGPEALDYNYKRLGANYDALSARNNMNMDRRLANEVSGAQANYERLVGTQQSPAVQKYIDEIAAHSAQNGGVIPGDTYQSLRSRLQKDIKSTSNAELGGTLKDIRGALDSAMERSLSPQEAALWKETNRQYAAQKVLEKAASRAGDATLEGQVTPQNLRGVIAGEGRKTGAYSRGQGQFNELARAGALVMRPLPTSGTAERANAFHWLNNLLGNVPGAVAGRALMSKPAQAYLANQLANGALPVTRDGRRLLAAELLREQAPQLIENKSDKNRR